MVVIHGPSDRSLVSEGEHTRRGKTSWVVTCQRGCEQFTAEGDSQLDAWQNALEAAA
jgi:hypothetical protein